MARSRTKDGRHDFGAAFALRTNLLRLATLTADFGLEYRLADARIAILLNGTYADWGWKEKQRRYKIWRVSPEARCYLGTRRRGFLGAMYHRGGFHYKLNATGKAGDYQGGGITGGYRLPSPVIGLSTSMPPQAILVPNTTNTPASGRSTSSATKAENS